MHCEESHGIDLDLTQKLYGENYATARFPTAPTARKCNTEIDTLYCTVLNEDRFPYTLYIYVYQLIYICTYIRIYIPTGLVRNSLRSIRRMKVYEEEKKKRD